MHLTVTRTVGQAASRCLSEACRDIRREWTNEELQLRQLQADEMQSRLWGAIHGQKMAPAPVYQAR